MEDVGAPGAHSCAVLVPGPGDRVVEAIPVDVAGGDGGAEEVLRRFSQQDGAGVGGLDRAAQGPVEHVGLARAAAGEELLGADHHVRDRVAVDVARRHRGAEAVVERFAEQGGVGARRR